MVRYSVRVNGFDTLALTKLDVLDEQAEVKICTAYRRDSGETLTEFPADLSLLEGSEAVYETMPGWQTSTAGVRDFSMLPAAAQTYVARLSELVNCEIGTSTARRTATILPSRAPSRPGSTDGAAEAGPGGARTRTHDHWRKATALPTELRRAA